MYVRTTQRLNHSGQQSKKTICRLWFRHTFDLETRSRSENEVWIDTPQARLFDKPRLNCVREQASEKKNFVKSGNT